MYIAEIIEGGMHVEPRILLWLCGLAYRDPPKKAYLRLTTRGEVPVRDVCQELLCLSDNGELPCGSLSRWEWESFARLMRTNLILCAYENRNNSSGFVGMAFKDETGVTVVAMRGSERSAGCAPTDIDWIDNFAAPFTTSVQYAEAEAFVRKLGSSKLLLTGHSKGGNNALYVLHALKAENVQAVVFNAQGFGCDKFSATQRKHLEKHGLNYVTRSDPVGALLCHPEKRVFTAERKGVHPHAPEAFVFDLAGMPMPGRRTLRSAAIEAVSRLMLPILRKVLPGKEGSGRPARASGKEHAASSGKNTLDVPR